jgi:serine phosphatase RsbU (regulator of sigma subunit)
MKSILIILSLIFYISNSYSQQLNPLSQKDQDYIDELKEFAETLSRQESFQDAANTYNQLAIFYWQKGYGKDAIDYFNKSINLNKKVGNLNDIKALYTNIGVIYTDLEEIDKALEFFLLSLEARKNLDEKEELSAGYIDVAFIYGILNQHDEAVEHLEEALNIAEQVDNENLILNCYQMLYQQYDAVGNTAKSNEFYNKFVAYQAFIDEEGMKQDFSQREVKTKAQTEKAMAETRAKELEIQMNKLLTDAQQDSLGRIIQAKQDSIKEVERANREKQIEIDLLSKERELQELAIKEQEAKEQLQNTIIFAGGGVLVLMIVLALVMYRNFKVKQRINKQLEKQKKAIEDKNQELEFAFDKISQQALSISQSINYAEGIQRAMLPEEGSLVNHLPESFILFRPRDVVSGDFYWYTELEDVSNIQNVLGHFNQGNIENKKASKNSRKKNFAISAVDCTGHGVPGAFMSMIGYNILDEIVARGITRADLMLDELHKGVRYALNQDTTDNKDGMDLAMCVVNRKEKRVEYAGAKNPLVYIKNGEAFQIKGDKNPIGGIQTENARKFENHIVPIEEPTWFYIFSDGFTDQFGGQHGRKFLIKNFRNLLLDIHQKPMEEQREILNTRIEEWMGDKYKQVDDIIIIGFKLDLNSI